MERDADVIVVGGGNAGFSAAHAAAERGRSVIVLERGEGQTAGEQLLHGRRYPYRPPGPRGARGVRGAR